MFSGVTSTSSSSAINSKACSKLRMIGVVSLKASSEPGSYICYMFFLHTFTNISSCFAFSPTIMPLYTLVPGFINNEPLPEHYKDRKWQLTIFPGNHGTFCALWIVHL